MRASPRSHAIRKQRGPFFMREQDSRSYPVREEMRLQYAFWAWERATWVAIAVVVLLALSGLFAHGPLSKRTVKDGALSLTYERFQRATAVASLAATISAPTADKVNLRLDPSFSDNFQIADIEPRPSSSTAGPRGLELVFRAPTEGDLAVVIWATPRSFGLFDLNATADPQGQVAFSILVYP
jgi:hypothetical protein